MQNKIIKFIGYSVLGIVILSIFSFFPLYFASHVLCAGCFLTIYGPKIVTFLYYFFAIYIIFRIYQKIFHPKAKKSFSILAMIMISSVMCLIISFAIIIGGDLLNIGGPYNTAF